jgi:hypothetical protein
MKSKGLVFKIDDEPYISFLNPKDNIPSYGISISEGPYKDMKDNEISYVDVEVKDGTEDIDISFDDFIENALNYNPGDIFYHIRDIMFFEYSNTIKEIIESDGLDSVLFDIIEYMEKNNNISNEI